MSKCRNCQNSVTIGYTFCTHCGARQTASTTRGKESEPPPTGVWCSGRHKRSITSRLKAFYIQNFRVESETEKRFSEMEKRFDEACQLVLFGASEAIPELENILILEPRNQHFKDTLAIFYAMAGDELFSHPKGFPGGPYNELLDHELIGGSTWRAKSKAEEILSWIRKIRQLKDGEALQHVETYKGLDEALNGSLSMFDKCLNINPHYPSGYSGRAKIFQLSAEGILMAYGIFPIRPLTKPRGNPIHYNNAQFGICIRTEMPDLEKFAAEILWLYKQSEENYREALKLNATDTKSYVELSHVLQHLGKLDEANNNINKALAILNKAIQADNADEQSYSERAEIFKEMGEIDSALSDLQRLFTLYTDDFKLDYTRRAIDELQKSESL